VQSIINAVIVLCVILFMRPKDEKDNPDV